MAVEPPDGQDAESAQADGPDGTGSFGPIDRRAFLIGAGTLVGAAAFDSVARASGFVSVGSGVLPSSLLQSTPVTESVLSGVESLQGVGPLPGADITFLVRRREDFLFLQFDGYNLKRDGDELVRKKAGDAYLVVSFTPQHVVEQAFPENETSSTSGDGAPLFDPSGNTPPPNPGAARAMLAYPSRLAFLVPRTLSSIPYTLSGLLDWASLMPSLVPAAAESGGLDTTVWQWQPPIAQQTSLELPWHLAISPSGNPNWSHPTDLLQSGGATELWHTRLADGTGPQAVDGGNFRGVWTFDTIVDSGSLFNGAPTLELDSPVDNQPDQGAFPYFQAVNQADRWEIVNATSNAQSRGRADAYANRLWLSARGGLLDSIGAWNIHGGDPGDGLAEWRHLATLGRDHYVKIVQRGYLFPFGHAVTKTTVSERQFQQVGTPGVNSEVNTVGAFRQISYLSVREPFLSYDSSVSPGIVNDSRDFPFRDITLKTLRSAYLLEPGPELPGLPPGPYGNGDVFVPTNDDGSLVTWHAMATDWAGRRVSMVLPALYISEKLSYDIGAMQAVRAAYNALPTSDPRRTANLQGQTVAFGAQYKAGDTDLKVQTITFGAAPGGFGEGSSTPYQDYSVPDVRPSLLPSTGGQAVVRLSAAEQAGGGGALPGNSEPAFSYYEPYVTNDGGFGGSNVGNVFVQSAGAVGNLVFGGGSGGGVLTPNVAIEGLSRSLGPIADLDNIFQGNFDPTSYFKQLESAQLLGGVTLGDVIKAVGLLDGSALDPGGADPPSTPDTPNSQVPQVSYSDDGTSITVTINWTPVINLNSDGSPQAPNLWLSSSNGSDSIPITLQGEITTDVLNPSNTTYNFTGEIQNFTFTLMSTDLAFIGISFDSLNFSAATGQGTNVSPEGLSATFLGSLTFLNDLEDLLSFAGDGGGPSISVTPSGISADLSISIPPVGVAIFTLSGISFDANFLLPLDGVSMAVFTFAFASEANPFTVSGGIFGGDGYFKIAIGTVGVQLITVSIAFGAMVALDIVVASGSVSLTAGITFSYMADPSQGGKETCVLTAFVKLEGSVSVLGIVSLSVTFDVTLTWQSPNDLFGSATLTVSISLFCFTLPVSMTVQKQFAGSTPSSSPAGMRESVKRALSPAADSIPGPMNYGEQMNETQWETYVSAFAAA